MSVRAYRVDQIVLKDDPSFNLWHDKELMDWLYNNTDIVTDDTGGMIEIPVDSLEQATKIVGISDDVKQALHDDIKHAKRGGEDYVVYNCF